MSDYSKAVVYKFHKDDLPEIYIGSTHDEIKREQDHKSVCNNENSKEYNKKVYEFMRDNGGYPCDNKNT